MNQPTIADVRAMNYFDSLSDEEAAEFASHLIAREYDAREYIVIEGDPPDGYYLLRSGKARIFRSGEEGREQSLRLLEAGDTFGEVPLFDGGGTPATVEALAPCEVVLVPTADFMRALHRHPEVAEALLRHFATRIRTFTELIRQISLQTVQSRLARYLYTVAREEGQQEAEGIVVPREITLQDLASFVGSVREVVSRTLKTMEDDGIVEVRRKSILIRDLAELRRLI